MLLITGSYPPQVCGVGDYTYRLISSPNAIDWKLYNSSDWSLRSLFLHIKNIKKYNENTVNMQYPTQGYGWSIVPHLLCLYFSWFTKKRFSVTIHEQSQSSFKARMAQKIILLTANKIIFTNKFEFDYAAKRIPFIAQRSTVIKIYSNIEASDRIKPIEDRKIDILNFGHIRPRKGLEEFIETVKEISNEFNVVIAGQVPEGYEDYYSHIESKAKKVGVKIILNLPSKDVSKLLNDTKLIYLPFPDGVSERRGSLLAAFVNGAVVLSSVGEFTTQELKDSIITKQNDLNFKLLLSNESLLKDKQFKATTFMQNNMPKSWDDVVEQYNTFIK